MDEFDLKIDRNDSNSFISKKTFNVPKIINFFKIKNL